MKKIKLNALAAQTLSQIEMNAVKGGTVDCGCSCYYANSGGSSTMDNGYANKATGKFSLKGKIVMFLADVICNG